MQKTHPLNGPIRHVLLLTLAPMALLTACYAPALAFSQTNLESTHHNDASYTLQSAWRGNPA